MNASKLLSLIVLFWRNCYRNIRMSSQNINRYMAAMVYEEVYSLEFNWQKHLPPKVFEFHNLLVRETNAPIDLHMGVVLPFVGSCLGPKTKGLFLTHPLVLNFFWINIATSCVWKSLAWHKFISKLMDYIVRNSNGKVKNFEISINPSAMHSHMQVWLIFHCALIQLWGNLLWRYVWRH